MAPAPNRLEAVRRACAEIRARFAGPIPLGDLAAAAGLSRFGLVRAFRRAVGVPPCAYHLRLRIDRARAMLAAGTPIARVAVDLGFADQSHLTRHFKRVVGVTPGTYARGGIGRTDAA